MFLHIEKAKYVDNYRIWVAFNNGASGIIDLANELDGEVFEPLQNIDFFMSFKIEGHTLSWANGADFAPEFLLELLVPDKLPVFVENVDERILAEAVA